MKALGIIILITPFLLAFGWVWWKESFKKMVKFILIIIIVEISFWIWFYGFYGWTKLIFD